MIQYFRNQGTEDIFNGRVTGAAQRTLPRTLWQSAVRKLDHLDSITHLNDLCGDLQDEHGRGQYRLPVLDLYEIQFVWGDTGPEQVAIVGGE